MKKKYFLFFYLAFTAAIYGQVIVVNSTSLSNFDYIPNAGPSAQQSFTFSGSNLNAGITVNAPSNFEISALSDALFTGNSSITIGQSGGVVNTITLYVRLKSGLSVNNYSGSINLISSGASTKTVTLNGTVAYPQATIIKSTGIISGFIYSLGNGPSTEKSFVVSGTNLTIGLTIAAPTNYEISALSGVNFVGTSSMTINQSGGVVNPTTIYVRLKSGLSVNAYISNISLSTTGTTTQTIELNGTVTPPHGINVSTTSLPELKYYLAAGPSAIQSFTVNGLGLTSDLFINAPTNFEISTAAGALFVSSSQLAITPVDGIINSTTIYVRLKTSLLANTYSGNISLSSLSATPKSIALRGLVVLPPSFMISKTNIIGFNYALGNGPSSEQSFTVNGSNLISSITINAPVDYEISTTNGALFNGVNQLIVSPVNGTINTVSIYIRLKASLRANTYAENVILSTTDAVNQSISLHADVTFPIGIGISTNSLENFTYSANTGPSAEKSFTTTGVNLSNFLIITAPTNFEISTGTGTSFVGTNQIILSPVNGTVTQTTIYIRLISNLFTGNYSGQISAISTGFTIKYLQIFGNVLSTSNLVKDPSSYSETNTYKFENLWIQSRNTSNFPANGYGLTTGSSRGMTFKDGKILICRRDAAIGGTLLNKYITPSVILVYNGATGDLEKTISIPDSIFHQKDIVGDTIRAVGYPSNDIHIDAAGNVIIANMTLNLATSPFIVAALKLNLTAGTVTQVKRVMKATAPLASTARIDAFNVYGNLFGTGYFMAAISGTTLGLSNFVYRWNVTNGVADIDNYKEIEIKRYVPIATKFNDTNPRVKPISETLFYLDGQASYPTLYDMNGNVIDTISVANYPASPGNNGVNEFVLGGKNFIVYSNSNTAIVPNSSWALAELGSGQSFANMTKLFIFPAGGMGSTSNPVRAAIPEIDVFGNEAFIYVYGFANGLAAYKLTNKTGWSGISELPKSTISISLVNNEIQISEEIALAEVYNINGQKIISLTNVSNFMAPSLRGIYLVSTTNKAGIKKIQKIIVY